MFKIKGKRLKVKINGLVLLTCLLAYSLTCCLYAETKKNATTKASPKYETKKSTATTKPDTSANIEKLKDKNWIIRRNAAITLGTEKNKKAVVPLINLLKDNNTEVRRCAAIALGEIGDKKAVPHLIKALNDTDGGMIIDSASSLGKLNDPSAIDGLLKLLSDGRPVIRITGLKALFSFKDDIKISSAVISCINDEAEGVRILAIQQAASLKLKSAIPNLIKNLSDVNLKVKVETIKALGEIGDKSTIEPLKKILVTEDEIPEVIELIEQTISKLEESGVKKSEKEDHNETK
ncbi:MAG: HEAT repeat domain-containing protein [Elusimicrobiota bacterium]